MAKVSKIAGLVLGISVSVFALQNNHCLSNKNEVIPSQFHSTLFIDFHQFGSHRLLQFKTRLIARLTPAL